MRIRLNLLPQFNNTLFVRINDSKITSFKKQKYYTILKNEQNEIVGYNIENFDYPKNGKITVTKEIIDKINKMIEQPLTVDYNEYLYVGKVIECTQHPHSDHLKVCQVDTKDEVLQIVCGAVNVAKDLLVVVAKEKAIVNDMFISKGKLLKVESNGMLCSAYELGLISEKKKGLLILDDTYEVGAPFKWKGEKHV